MDPVKKKVISELFFAPSVVLPMVAGISAGLLSWAGGGVNYLSAAAVAGILGGLGWMATRIIFKVEQITEEALKLHLSQKALATEAELDHLHAQLMADGDPRTQDYLTLLRSLREEFAEISSQPGVRARAQPLGDRVSEVFEGCVDQLRQSLRLRSLAVKLSGVTRREIEAEREQLVQGVARAIEHLRQTVGQFRDLIKRDTRAELGSLLDELDATLRVAKLTEQRLRELEFDPSLERAQPTRE